MKQKVFLIVDSNSKVYARVFSNEEKANKAIDERDEETGERIYPESCHVIERIIE